MNMNYIKAGVAATSAMMLLPGCIDNNYDLSDIDTTTELKVNDLAVPLNLKSITLDNVIDVDEEDPDATIKYVTIGDQRYFAIEKHGEFHAEPTEVKEVKAPKPSDIEPIEQTLQGTAAEISGLPKKAPGGISAMRYTINEDHTTFVYEVGQNGNEKVDESIQSIEEIKMANEKLHIRVQLTSSDLSTVADYIEFRDLKLLLPQGMKATCPTSGATINDRMLTVPYLKGTGNNAYLDIYSDDINFREEYGETGIPVKDGEFDYSAYLGVEGGTLTVYPKNGATIQSEIDFTIHYDLSSFVVTEMSGKVEYTTTIENIDAVELSDLPDFLQGNKTNLIMSNPQLTLNVNNPAGAYNLGCNSGLTIKSIKNNVMVNETSLPGDFHIGYKNGDGPYMMIIAPRPNDAINVPDFPNTEKYTFEGLSYILAGEGLPDRLEIELASASQPEPQVAGDAQNFPLGRKLQDVDGEYTFMTLLALDDGSTIVYEKKDDGWNDEDIDALHITEFEVSATATTDIPCGVKLWVRPLDVNGQDIEISNPEGGETDIPAMANDKPFKLTLKGDIKHLDGIHFVATATDFNGEALVPSQNIKLNNLQVRVTGTYTKKL